MLKALQSLAQQQGLHLRLGTGKRVEIGKFGESAGVTLLKIDINHPDLDTNPNIAAIESCRLQSNSEDLITWLLPLARWAERRQRADPAILQPHQRPLHHQDHDRAGRAHPVLHAEHLRSSEIRRHRQSRDV